MEREELRILLVEDNPGDARLIQEHLAVGAREIFRIDQCDDLASAQARLAGTGVDAVLLDLGLPDSQGLDTLRGIRKQAARLPIVVLTGLQDEETGLEAIREGAQDYLTKDGLTSDLLATTLRYAVARERVQEELRAERDFRDAMLQTAQVTVVVLDSTGHIVRFNRHFEELCGVELEEVRGKDWFETFLPKADHARIRALFARAIAGQPTLGEVNPIVTRSGEYRWLEWYDKTLTTPSGEVTLVSIAVDVTEKRRMARQQALAAAVLGILNRPNEWQALIADILEAIQTSTSLEAVAIRIEHEGDFPYAAVRGFPPEFIVTEKSLVCRDAAGLPQLDAAGEKELACMCGNVIQGRTDPTQPFFTEFGSFWTNSTTQLLAATTEKERQSLTRDQCNAFGYESVAVIPVRANGNTVGLLQLNDRRPNRFNVETIRFFEGLSASVGVAFKRQQAEGRITKLLDRQTHINRLTLGLGTLTGLRATLHALHEEIRTLLDADGFFVSRYDRGAGLITALFVVDAGVERDVATFPVVPLAPEGRGMQSQVLRTCKPLNVRNWLEGEHRLRTVHHITSDGAFTPPPPETERDDCTKSALLVPMLLQGEPIGVLQLQSNRLNAYSDEDMDLLSGLANVAAIAIQNAQLFEAAERDAQAIRKALDGTIHAFARATEVRDPYTAGHQVRVAHLARGIAIRMELSESRVAGIHAAGLLHDTGKLSIPAEILSKPTRLTEIEFALIKSHPQAGADLLEGVDFPWPLSEFVLQHHERIDGSGYPQGLKGNAIHLEAKILAVADVVEAMAAHRPYRPALGIDKALDEITQKRGVLFDPTVVDACVGLFRSGEYHLPK